MSISSTFYNQLFCYSQLFANEYFSQTNIGEKAARKMMMKLTIDVNFSISTSTTTTISTTAIYLFSIHEKTSIRN